MLYYRSLLRFTKAFTLASVALAILLTGCAKRYRAINPQLLAYPANSAKSGIGSAFNYNILMETRNRKYATHEAKQHVKLVAVRITNHTDRRIDLSQDIEFYSGGDRMLPLAPDAVRKKLKQQVPFYLFYLFLTPINLYTRIDSPYSTEAYSVFPIGLVVGPVVTGGNMLVAGYANKAFYKELQMYDLNRDLEAGDTTYGLICFPNLDLEDLTVTLKPGPVR